MPPSDAATPPSRCDPEGLDSLRASAGDLPGALAPFFGLGFGFGWCSGALLLEIEDLFVR